MTNVHTLQSESKTHVHNLQRFDEFFKKKNCQICVIVVFNNVNTVRSEMWVLVFPHHSCQKLIKSLVFDSWFDKIFWHLWCGKSHTHISSSQYPLNVWKSLKKFIWKTWNIQFNYWFQTNFFFFGKQMFFNQNVNRFPIKTIWFYYVANCSSATRLNISVQILFKLLSISTWRIEKKCIGNKQNKCCVNSMLWSIFPKISSG